LLSIRAGVAIAAHLGVAVASQPAARAQLSLDYQAASDLGCPTADELRGAVAQQLEYDPFVPVDLAPAHRARIVLTKTGTTLEGQIDWIDRQGRGEGGRRLTFETADCAELARAVVFAVVVQMQLLASPTRPPSSSKRPGERPGSAGVAPQPSRQSYRKTRMALLGAGPTLERGWSPAPALGLAVLGALSSGAVWLEAGAAVSVPTTFELADGSGFRARSLRGWLAPCVRTPPWNWCLTGMIARVYVRGRGVDEALSSGSMLAATGGKVELLWPALERLGVLLHVEALVTLTPRDVLLNGGSVWSTSPMYLGVGADLATIFK
jgi:hypothetical protein